MPSRREFTRALLAPALLPSAALPAGNNIHWSLGAVTWVVKTGKKPLAWSDILPDVAAAGFDGVEPFTSPTLPVDDQHMDDLQSLLPKYKLRVAGIYWGDKFSVESELPRLLKDCHRFLGYLKRFGSDRLIIGPPSANVEDENAAIKTMAKAMNAIGKVAIDEYKIKMGVHPHVGGLIENPRQIDQLMAETDPKYFYFAPDTAQIWMGGGDPVKMIERYKHRVAYLHYKDIRAYNRGLKNYLDNVIELGRGVIDFPALHRILKSVNYKGWITIDLDNARITPLESAKVNRAYISERLDPIYR
jgi:inosose dehydratase